MWFVTTAVLEGSAFAAPPVPAEAAADGWLMAIGLPFDALTISNKLDGRLPTPS